RNGAGKSTLLKTLAGAVAARFGSVVLGDVEVSRMPARKIARIGLQLVPEERRVTGGITVHENLALAAMTVGRPLNIDEIYATFPRLTERRSNKGRGLSGATGRWLPSPAQ